MKQKEERVSKHLPISMSVEFWNLAYKHLVVLEYEAGARRMPKPSLAQVITSVYTLFLAQESDNIRQKFMEIARDGFELELPKFFGPADLEAISGNTLVSSLSNDPGDGRPTSGRTRKTKAQGPGDVRGVIGGPQGLARSLARESRRLRPEARSGVAATPDRPDPGQPRPPIPWPVGRRDR